jgi:hypothetical protein
MKHELMASLDLGTISGKGSAAIKEAAVKNEFR